MLVLVSCEYPPRLGGAGTLAKKMGDSDSRIKVLYPRLSNIAASRNSIFRYFWLLELTLILVFKCPNNAKICLNDFGALSSFYIAQKIRRLRYISLSYLNHGLISESFSKAISVKENLLVTLTNRLNCKHFAVSDFLSDQLRLKHGIPSIPLPIGIFAMDNYDHIDIDKSDSSKFIIVIASRLNRRKLPLEIFELFSYLESRLNRNLIIEVYGDGGSNYVSQLGEFAKKLNLKVSFNGNVPSPIVNKAIKSCDLVVNGSLLKEAAPTLGFEAAAHKKPYIYFTKSGHAYTQKYNSRWSMMISDFGSDSANLIYEAIVRDVENLQLNVIPSRDELIKELFS